MPDGIMAEAEIAGTDRSRHGEEGPDAVNLESL